MHTALPLVKSVMLVQNSRSNVWFWDKMSLPHLYNRVFPLGFSTGHLDELISPVFAVQCAYCGNGTDYYFLTPHISTWLLTSRCGHTDWGWCAYRPLRTLSSATCRCFPYFFFHFYTYTYMAGSLEHSLSTTVNVSHASSAVIRYNH